MGGAQSNEQYLKNVLPTNLPLKLYSNFDQLNCQYDQRYATNYNQAIRLNDSIPLARGVPYPPKDKCVPILTLWDGGTSAARSQLCSTPSSGSELPSAPLPTLSEIQQLITGIIIGCKNGMNQKIQLIGGTLNVDTPEGIAKRFVVLDVMNAIYV